jgi:hypothetical protein
MKSVTGTCQLSNNNQMISSLQKDPATTKPMQ